MMLGNRLLNAISLVFLLSLVQLAWGQAINIQTLTPAQRSAAAAALQTPEGQAALQGAGQNGTAPKESVGARQVERGAVVVEKVPLSGVFSGLGLRPFGESVFSNGSSITTPSDMPVPSDYVIGVGDVVEIRMFGKENRMSQLRVERNGVLTVPEIGPITVLGMTFETMSKTLLERIAKQKIGVEATISMGALRSIQVFLAGEVNRSGAYTTDGLTTLVNALLIGGGVRPTGSMRRVEIHRQGRVVAKVDLYDTLLKGSDRAEIRLQSGDTVFVPTVGRRVAVSGDVLKPAVYELLGEKSVDDVIRLAGGMLPSSYPVRAKLDRIGRNGFKETIGLPTPEKRAMLVEDGDSIFIPSVLGRSEKSLTISGHVPNPGTIEWKPGSHVGMFFSHPYDLLADYYRPFAVIERTEDKTGAKYFVSFNLYDVMHKGLQVPLQPEDKLIVLNHTDVEFLSSISVQNVLFGKLPPSAGGGGASVVSGSSNLKIETESQGATVGVNDALNGKREAGISVYAMDGHCKGLLELSDIVHQEGADRFRAALLTSSVTSEKARLMKNQPCTSIYSQYPGLLSFLLENAVTVRGEVKNPGVLPVPPGLTVDVALSARGGLTRTADPEGIEVTSSVASPAGVSTKRATSSLQALLQTELQPGSTVLVRKRLSDQDSGLVRLGGEFTHPGSYTIRRGEKLSELIARAGGVTSFAYPYGAVFDRVSVKEEKKIYYAKAAQELQQAILFGMTRQRASGATSDGTASAAPFVMSVMNDLKNMNPTGRVVVEADPTVLQVRPELDVVLQPGDEIYMPRRPASINVMGEVLNPGAVQFQSGKSALDYVKAAGGTTKMADLDRVYAILPNGTAEPLKISSWNFMPTLLPPGSTVFVTREVMPTTSLDLMLIITQMAKDLALAAASIYVISK